MKLLDGSREVPNSFTFQIGANGAQSTLTYLTTKDGSASLQSFKIDVDSGAGGVLSATDAKKISIMDDVIEKISSERSMLGAKQNHLEFTYNNLMNQAENLQNAESRIRDADIAKEMMEYTKASMLYQVSLILLAQANQQQAMILKLLQ